MQYCVRRVIYVTGQIKYVMKIGIKNLIKFIFIILLSYPFFLFSQGIKIENHNGKTNVLFINGEKLSLDTISSVYLSPDSSRCAIRTYYGDFTKGLLEIYNEFGVKLNNDSLIGESINFSNDNRVVIYNPEWNGYFTPHLTFRLFDKNINEVKVNYRFNFRLNYHFFDNGFLFVIHDKDSEQYFPLNYYKAVLLDKEYNIIAQNDSFYFSSYKFIPPYIKNKNIVLPIFEKDSILRTYYYNSKLKLLRIK